MSLAHMPAEPNPPSKPTIKERGEKRLQMALRLAKGGFSVFPLAANSKLPLKGSSGFKDATRDPDKIRELFSKASICNIAIRCDQFEGRPIIVLDEDGPEAVAKIAEWEVANGELPETLCSITRKGRHRFFFVSEPIGGSIRKAGVELDIKGFDGYVVAPGSTVKGDDGVIHEYAFEKPCEIAAAPEWFEDIARKAASTFGGVDRPSAAGQVLEGINPARAEKRAIEYLKTAPVSVKGHGGHNTAYKVAANLKDLGCSKEQTLDLMLSEHWHDGCGWSAIRLEEPVRNAFRYGKEAQGAKAPEALFSAIGEAPDATEKAQDAPSVSMGGRFIFDGHAPLQPQRALIKRLIPFQGVVFIGGPSGAGKSFIAVQLAVCAASGKSFFGHKVAGRVGVAFVAAEGAATIDRRLRVAKLADDIEDDLPVAWVDNVPDLSTTSGRSWLASELEILVAKLQSDHKVRLGMVIIDTLGAAFGMKDENSNAEANALIRDLRTITEKTGAVVVAVHHYGKSAETGLRGASAYRGGADAVLSVMANRSETTGEVSNRRLALAKSRVGEEGPISCFTLEEMKLGRDEDWEEFGSCYVKPCDAEEAEARRLAKPLKADEQIYLQSLEAAGKAAQSPDKLFGPGEPINRELVRAEFYSRKPVDGDAKKQAETKRKAFARSETDLKQREMIDMRETTEAVMVWRLS